MGGACRRSAFLAPASLDSNDSTPVMHFRDFYAAAAASTSGQVPLPRFGSDSPVASEEAEVEGASQRMAPRVADLASSEDIRKSRTSSVSTCTGPRSAMGSAWTISSTGSESPACASTSLSRTQSFLGLMGRKVSEPLSDEPTQDAHAVSSCSQKKHLDVATLRWFKHLPSDAD